MELTNEERLNFSIPLRQIAGEKHDSKHNPDNDIFLWGLHIHIHEYATEHAQTKN